tara:strand:- start:4332 stop:4529 length:198 start_codon:yes stop_codon:yes gene_type:complete
MITVEATAATKISAMNTIMAPILMEPSLDFMHDIGVPNSCIYYCKISPVYFYLITGEEKIHIDNI